MQNIKNLSRKSHKKFKLLCHLIFSTKYRRKIFLNKNIKEALNNLLNFEFKQFKIITHETDKDHIHFMIEYEPEISISKIVQIIKSYTTYHLWKECFSHLKQYYWYKKYLWTKAYFVCSIGNSNPETIKNYIMNQG